MIRQQNVPHLNKILDVTTRKKSKTKIGKGIGKMNDYFENLSNTNGLGHATTGCNFFFQKSFCHLFLFFFFFFLYLEYYFNYRLLRN